MSKVTQEMQDAENQLSDTEAYRTAKSWLVDNHTGLISVCVKMVWTLTVGVIVLVWTIIKIPMRMFGITTTQPKSKLEI